MLLAPLLGGTAIRACCWPSRSPSATKARKRTTRSPPSRQRTEIAKQLTADLEGTPTPVDIRRAQKPLGERRRILHEHPHFSLYKIAKRRFDVSWYLVAAVHYQETGFGEAPMTLAKQEHWRRHRNATQDIRRPTRYPNRARSHPSVKDDFDVVMAIAANLEANGAKNLGDDARHSKPATARAPRGA